MIWTAATAALALTFAPATPALRLPPAAVAAGGAFVDRAGASHPWQINRAHALIWDGQPYVPAGVVLNVPGDASGQAPDVSPAESTASTAVGAGRLAPTVSSALDLLAAHGVHDVCLVRAGGWLAGSGAADQTLVDALESRGMRYGVALDARPESPLVGFLAEPTRLEVPAGWRQPGKRLKWSVPLPGARAALYALVDLDSDNVVAAGRVPVTDGQARIEVALRPARRMFAPGAARLLVLPERVFTGAEGEQPIDFWSGWDDLRTRLAARLAAVHWGPGLRFFARPAPASLALRGESEDRVPASGGFRLQFESWLERRYSIGDLNGAWALNDRQAPSLTVAARLVPLWPRGERGEKSGWLLDPVTDEWYRADLRRSGFWRDFEQFRTESMRRALSETATLLKKTVADVPVVMEWTEYHPLFTDPQAVGGMDGLAFTARGWGREAATGSAAFAYAQAEGAEGPSWFIQLGERPGASAPPASADELRLDWDWLREIGCKGFFVDGLSAGEGATAGRGDGGTGKREDQTTEPRPGTPRGEGDGSGTGAPNRPGQPEQGSTPDESDAASPGPSVPSSPRPPVDTSLRPAWDLSAPAERLDWVRDYAGKIASVDSVATYRPAVLYFPSDAVGLGLTERLDSGVWWLPSFAAGRELTLGDEIEGYWIERSPDPAPADAARGVVVLWSTGEPRKATFVAPPQAAVHAYDALGRPLPAVTKHGRLQLALDSNPVIVTGLPLDSVFPVETASEALKEYEVLLKQAEAQKLDVAALRLTLNQAKTLFTPSTAATTYALIRTPLSMLRGALTPYLWIEAEAAAHHNWSGVQPDPRASGGAVLHLDRAAPPEGGAYQARIGFRIEREATYEVWLAGSMPGSRDVSNFTWRIDDRAPSLVLADGSSHRYSGTLGWTRLGQVALTPGLHSLMLTVAGPASSGGYHLDVDALVLSREPFQPDGIRRPSLGAAEALGPRSGTRSTSGAR